MIEIERGYVLAVMAPLEQIISRLDAEKKLKAMTSFRLAKLVGKLSASFQELAADNSSLAQRHGGKRTEQGVWEFASDEARAAFEKDWQEVISEKISIDFKPFSIEDFSEDGRPLITFAELRLLLPFISGPD